MGQAGKLSITLTPELVSAVHEKVAQGRFKTNSEVMRAALRLWLDEEAERETRLEVIKAKLQRSVDDPSPTIPAEEVFEDLEARLKARMADKV